MMDKRLTHLTNDLCLNAGASEQEISAAEQELGGSLPGSYKRFLTEANGGSGPIGSESFVDLWEVSELGPKNRSYKPSSDYAPGLTFIGTDGGNEVYAVRNADGYFVSAPLIGMDEGSVDELAASFTEFLEALP